MPVPSPGGSEDVVARVKMLALRLVGHYALAFNDGEDLIG